MSKNTPILDNHLHLNPEEGDGIEAVDAFASMGGTHMLIVNLPSWYFDVQASKGEDFQPVFDKTVEIAKQATTRLPGKAWPVLGVHPGLISKLIERGESPDSAKEIMQSGIETAAEYVAEGKALALKSGRPHYDVSDEVWQASNDVMRHAFQMGAEHDCVVQLHTEGGSDFSEVTTWSKEVGLDSKHVVKHYSQGPIEGPVPSVISSKDAIEEAAEGDELFFMETDFLDDPDRPGAVLGPKTVPRRVRWMEENGYEEAIYRAHVEAPKRVYGIDTESTL